MWSLNPHQPGCFWFDAAEWSGPPNVKWCEETLCQFVSQPANTWSNLGYILVALLLTYWSISRRKSRPLQLYGPILFLLGICSLFYHLSNFYLSQIFDFVGMFLFCGWVIGMNAIRLSWLKKDRLIPFVVAQTCGLLIVMQFMRWLGWKYQTIILLATIFINVTEYLSRNMKQIKYFYFALSNLLLGIAFACSISDLTRRVCDPHEHGLFSQGHALWHWVGALAMWTIYAHYAQPALQDSDEK